MLFLALLLLLLVALHGQTAQGADNILILAQGRSGSTFLSSWFGSLPNVTYFIEPCSLVYGDNTTRDRTGEDCARFIKELFACDFSRANVARNQSAFIPEVARKAFKGWGHQGNSSDVLECETKRAHVTKELRMGMVWAKRLIDFDRVIVLFRDPRAIMNSRQTDWPKPAKSFTKQDDSVNPHGWNGKTGFPYSQSLRSLCIEHLALRKRVEEDGEGKVLAIEYSQVLADSLAVSKLAMEFTHLQEFAPVVEEHVTRNLNGDCVDPDSPFSVCRTKVPKLDTKWRKTLSIDTLNQLSDIPECEQVLSTYYSSSKPRSNQEL